MQNSETWVSILRIVTRATFSAVYIHDTTTAYLRFSSVFQVRIASARHGMVPMDNNVSKKSMNINVLFPGREENSVETMFHPSQL
jgi:hypothetical protein